MHHLLLPAARGGLRGCSCGTVSHNTLYSWQVPFETPGISKKKLLKTCQQFILKIQNKGDRNGPGETPHTEAQPEGTSLSGDVTTGSAKRKRERAQELQRGGEQAAAGLSHRAPPSLRAGGYLSSAGSGMPASVRAAWNCIRTPRMLLMKPLESGKRGKPMSG